jgi:wyosine [tRNA(Phe)-imidazoG37] synthetase (radical SAM superfamily)
MIIMEEEKLFKSVYGPLKSWRYGKSLGIDPIGKTSVCSFNCVYCQLGEIEIITKERRIFVPTETILNDLKSFAPWNEIDIITLSGSGEPTLALNLGEILKGIKKITNHQTLVLTNGTLLDDPQVRLELNYADQISVKLDGLNQDQLRRINRPVDSINLVQIQGGIEKFAQEYQGKMSIQTMILTPWNDEIRENYLQIIKKLNSLRPESIPLEIQLNLPSRPKPLKRQLDGRGNHSQGEKRDYPIQMLKCMDWQILKDLGDKIHQQLGLRVSLPSI